MSTYTNKDVLTKWKNRRYEAKVDSLNIQSNFLETLCSRHLQWSNLAENSEIRQIHREIVLLLQQINLLYKRLLEIYSPHS